MNRIAIVLLALLAWPVPARAVELIADPAFRDGFTAKDDQGRTRVVRYGGTAAPVWRTAQHHSKSSMATEDHYTYRDGGCTFDDGLQTLIVHPADLDADLVLGVNAFREYGGVYRRPGDAWPHLLMLQRFSLPRGHLGEGSPRLSQMQRLDLTIRVRLLYDRPHTGPGYDPHLHAAQFVFYFTVQNLQRASKGYGDYYWFGVTLYDSRRDVTRLQALQDKGSPKKKGTDKLIYNVGIAPFTSEVVARGQWVTVQGDLLPHLLAGLHEAWNRGFLPDSRDLDDYRIGEMNFGWEVTGLNDAAVAVKDLRATAVLRGEESGEQGAGGREKGAAR